MTSSIRFPHCGQQSALCGGFTGGTAVPEAKGTGGEGMAGEEDAAAWATWDQIPEEAALGDTTSAGVRTEAAIVCENMNI